MANDKTSGMKSAYELALERMEQQGIERPREDALDGATREAMAEVRRRAEAKLAEMEILHRDRLPPATNPAARQQAEAEHKRDRQRVEDDRDRKLAALRRDG